MRYWGIFAGKVLAAGAVMYGIWLLMMALYVPPEHIVKWRQSPFPHDLKFTSMVLVFHLLAQGVIFLIIWDQRWRCRTCGRRLRMPVSHGGYGQMLLFGRPRTEYICSYGHGTLVQPDLHLAGREPSDWKPHDMDNIWDELYALEKKDGRQND